MVGVKSDAANSFSQSELGATVETKAATFTAVCFMLMPDS
jgi:hypothetical protein